MGPFRPPLLINNMFEKKKNSFVIIIAEVNINTGDQCWVIDFFWFIYCNDKVLFSVLGWLIDLN